MDRETERDKSTVVKPHSSLKCTHEQPRVLKSIEHKAVMKEYLNKEGEK